MDIFLEFANIAERLVRTECMRNTCMEVKLTASHWPALHNGLMHGVFQCFSIILTRLLIFAHFLISWCVFIHLVFYVCCLRLQTWWNVVLLSLSSETCLLALKMDLTGHILHLSRQTHSRVAIVYVSRHARMDT